MQNIKCAGLSGPSDSPLFAAIRDEQCSHCGKSIGGLTVAQIIGSSFSGLCFDRKQTRFPFPLQNYRPPGSCSCTKATTTTTWREQRNQAKESPYVSEKPVFLQENYSCTCTVRKTKAYDSQLSNAVCHKSIHRFSITTRNHSQWVCHIKQQTGTRALSLTVHQVLINTILVGCRSLKKSLANLCGDITDGTWTVRDEHG